MASLILWHFLILKEGLALNLKAILLLGEDPLGKQGQDYGLWSILALIVTSLLRGRRGMEAAFLMGQSLTPRQQAGLGLRHGRTPCHATLTQTLRVIGATGAG